MFKAVRTHRFYHWTKEMLEDYNHTMELRMVGQQLIMTDDPENIKAIQDTQVITPIGLHLGYQLNSAVLGCRQVRRAT